MCYNTGDFKVKKYFVGNSTYAFTVILATFLFGLALGSLFAAEFVVVPVFSLQKGITVLACMNLTIALTAVFYSSLGQFLKYVTLAGTTPITVAGIFYLPPHLITRAYE